MEKILVLGASGTVGAAVYRQLGQCSAFDLYGTYFHRKPDDPQMRYFSLEEPEHINDLLAEIAPDIVISALRGDFERQMEVHILTAEYLREHQGRMLFLSTANVFDGDLTSPHYEDDIPQSVSEYGKFKILCEDGLRERLGDRAVILRIPFVFGRNSARTLQVKAGCQAGTVDVYKNLVSNYVTDLQIADYVEWIVKEKKEGIFHIGTTDVMDYGEFARRLVRKFCTEYPTFHYLDAGGNMAVLSRRRDVPSRMEWNVDRVVTFL